MTKDKDAAERAMKARDVMPLFRARAKIANALTTLIEAQCELRDFGEPASEDFRKMVTGLMVEESNMNQMLYRRLEEALK